MKTKLLLLSLCSGVIIPGTCFGISLEGNCTNYAAMLEMCRPYACTYIHPFTKKPMEKRIVGEKNGKCLTTEQMPGNTRLECAYTAETRKAIAQFHRDLSAAKETTGSAHITILGNDPSTTRTTLDGKVVKNPMQEAVESGQCQVSGYRQQQ